MEQTVIRPRPNPPLPGIPAGPSPVLPIGILNAAEIKMANLKLNYHNAAINREKESNLLCTKYVAIMQYVVSALLSFIRQMRINCQCGHLAVTHSLSQRVQNTT